jgi:hypothetical protein
LVGSRHSAAIPPPWNNQPADKLVYLHRSRIDPACQNIDASRHTAASMSEQPCG